MIYYLLLEKVSTFYKQEPNTDILCLCNNKKWPSKFLNLGIVRVVQLNLSIIETRRTPIRYPRQTYCLTSNNIFFYNVLCLSVTCMVLFKSILANFDSL